MKQDSDDRRARRGYAILAALLLLGVLTFNVDTLAGWLRDELTVVALVKQTNGIRVGSAVLVEGVPSGRVTELRFITRDGEPRIVLELRLDADVEPVLRQGASARTAKRRFIGEANVLVAAGPADAPVLGPGDTIPPSDVPTLESLMDRGQRLPAVIDTLMGSLEALETEFAGARPRLAELGEQLAGVGREAEALRLELDGGSIGQWLEDPGFSGRLDRLRDRLEELDQVAERIARYGPDSELARRASAVAVRGARLRSSIDSLQEMIRDGDGTLSRLQRDSAIAVAIRGVQAQIDSLGAEGLGFALRMLRP